MATTLWLALQRGKLSQFDNNINKIQELKEFADMQLVICYLFYLEYAEMC